MSLVVMMLVFIRWLDFSVFVRNYTMSRDRSFQFQCPQAVENRKQRCVNFRNLRLAKYILSVLTKVSAADRGRFFSLQRRTRTLKKGLVQGALAVTVRRTLSCQAALAEDSKIFRNVFHPAAPLSSRGSVL